MRLTEEKEMLFNSILDENNAQDKKRMREALVAGANGLQYVDDPRNEGKFDAADALIQKLNFNRK